MGFVLWRPTYFCWHGVLGAPPHCSLPGLHCLLGPNTLCGADRPHFVYLLTPRWTYGLRPPFGSCAAPNTGLQMSVQVPALDSLEHG